MSLNSHQVVYQDSCFLELPEAVISSTNSNVIYVLPNELMNFLQTFNAARSCFLPAEEKKDLLRQLKKLYGMEEDDN